MHRESTDRSGGGQRIAFANTLRGVAALSVVWLHLGVNFWYGKGYTYGLLGLSGPAPESSVPWWAHASHALQTFGTSQGYFDFGAFGVAVFFLLSGFVIPMSVVRLGPSRFVASRMLRIYPVYAVSLAIWLLVAWGLFQSGLRPAAPDWGWDRLLAQALLVSTLTGFERIDPVSWTLEVELVFYVIVAMSYGQIRRHRLGGVACLLAVVLGVALLVHVAAAQTRPWHGWFVKDALVVRMLPTLAFVGYIFAGYVFHLRWLGRTGWPATIGWLACIQAVTSTAFVLFPVPPAIVLSLAVNQLLAMLVFGVMLVGFPNARHPVLDTLSAISFPLYTTHLMVGLTTLALLDRLGLPSGASLALAALLVPAVALAVHRFVERPSLVLIARLGRQAPVPQNAAPDARSAARRRPT